MSKFRELVEKILTEAQVFKVDFNKLGEDAINNALPHHTLDEPEAYVEIEEDTVKQGKSWVNKGKEGTHGKFKTKKAADAQRKAMFANGYKG